MSNIIDRLKRLLPDPETVRKSRWLRWIGPALHHPRLWRPTRRGIALGIALGVFFGLLVPLAQIPLSAGMAVLLRASVPTAIASTLVTNPVTFGPIYYAAYRIGVTLIGEDEARATKKPPIPRGEGAAAWLASAWDRITTVGKPLLLGLAIMASTLGLLAYLIVTLLWRLKISLSWRRRRRKPAPPREDTEQKD
ncbi:hypothetical protein SCD_n02006 [Sulfuricella denitrificans skB26]|uniref:DUF2062 domain-containing protein n=1 Tax=Sulfuricella denitrificans (strain DSM 22764 / NBRC 105220 / skB26) TaxID=1163617 RepID=S6B5K5_SULDS|nr:DUF2062 domain-containing protein [Sulfuricella denitrificans]BAN35817.1 hypothetical protein SCD_n02006 [Sulfuricella denitrificans skB26]